MSECHNEVSRYKIPSGITLIYTAEGQFHRKLGLVSQIHRKLISKSQITGNSKTQSQFTGNVESQITEK